MIEIRYLKWIHAQNSVIKWSTSPSNVAAPMVPSLVRTARRSGTVESTNVPEDAEVPEDAMVKLLINVDCGEDRDCRFKELNKSKERRVLGSGIWINLETGSGVNLMPSRVGEPARTADARRQIVSENNRYPKKRVRTSVWG
jgi:hypothetical protein